ncbi:Fc.00g053370.m01.CDS01 [Cosmosporella sp. VM-42]
MIETPAQSSPVQNAGRLKYADPRDLPSYPSTGLRPNGAAASAAASLGWSNQKTIETWKPDKTSSASTAASLGWSNQKTIETWKPDKASSASAAAVLAKNYKMAPLWEPPTNTAPARAAHLAFGSANSSNKSPIPRSPQDNWGSSAATQAFNSNRSNSLKQTDYTSSLTSAQGQRSLAAAKGAMSGTRPRAISTPASPPGKETYPGESMAASNALSGATLAHRASMKAKPAVEGSGAVPVTTMTRNMFTSRPPVKPEVDEQQNNEKLHATAVAMARKMYIQQQKMVDQAKEAQGQDSKDADPKPYINLQDAAFKQAQERLAKLHDTHQKNRGYQDYYGNTQSPHHRFSLTSKLRRRASSDSDLDDRQQSERIRQQMSMFSDKLSQVDQKKRQKDRDALMAAAQRNVKAQLQGMDQKVYNETGMVNPTMVTDWEARAHQAAQVKHDARNVNKGKIDIGGGKFMDQSEVDAIATKRVQPVLDDINEKAEAERERQAVAKMEEESRKAELEKQKARDREVKEIHKKLKDQEKQDEKARRHQEKLEEKAKKDEEKALKAEQKHQVKEEKQPSESEPATVPNLGSGGVTYSQVINHDDSDDERTRNEDHSETQRSTEVPATTTDQSNLEHEEHKVPESATSPTSKVKGWIKNRFSRGKSVSENDKSKEKGKGFIGGAALRDTEGNHSTTSLDNRSTSIRDVALAGKSGEFETNDEEGLRDSRGVSPVSSEDEGIDCFETSRDYTLSPPKPITDSAARTSSSPTRDSRFREMMDN